MTVVTIQCATAGCGHSPFPVAAEFDDRARKTGETFYCPAGHPLVYNEGKTADQILIAQLEAELECVTSERNRLRVERDKALRACAWVGCEFVAATGDSGDRRALWSHLRAAHGMPALSAVQVEESA